MVKTAFLFLTFSAIVFAINGGYGQYHLQSKWLYLFFYYFGRTPSRTRHETLVKYYNKKEGKQKKAFFNSSSKSATIFLDTYSQLKQLTLLKRDMQSLLKRTI